MVPYVNTGVPYVNTGVPDVNTGVPGRLAMKGQLVSEYAAADSQCYI